MTKNAINLKSAKQSVRHFGVFGSKLSFLGQFCAGFWGWHYSLNRHQIVGIGPTTGTRIKAGFSPVFAFSNHQQDFKPVFIKFKKIYRMSEAWQIKSND